MKKSAAVTPKIPKLRIVSNMTVLEYMFQRAARKWPELVAADELGLVGIDVKTGDLYFQQWGNPEPFIVREERGEQA